MACSPPPLFVCPPLAMIDRYVMERLSPVDRSYVNSHLDRCDKCARWVMETRLMLAIVELAGEGFR